MTLLKIVDDYQSRIFAAEKTSEKQWNNDPWSFPMPELHDIASRALVTEGKNPTRGYTGFRPDWRILLIELGNTAGYEELAKAVPAIFDFAEPREDPVGWTAEKFGTSPRVWSLIYLDGLETDLKLLKAGLN